MTLKSASIHAFQTLGVFSLFYLVFFSFVLVLLVWSLYDFLIFVLGDEGRALLESLLTKYKSQAVKLLLADFAVC